MRRNTAILGSKSSFHQDRLAATDVKQKIGTPLNIDIRAPKSEAEMRAIGWLRAMSFYAYPLERKFAGEVHQAMVAHEELQLLLQQDDKDKGIITLLAISDPTALEIFPDDRLLLEDCNQTVVGSLDLHIARALIGEALIGDTENAAYLANVCTSECAKRRGVGSALLKVARETARKMGVKTLYVHTMAVNEIAMKFYLGQGFIVEKEETSNQAHYRGRCLDGIEGRGRTVLLRDLCFEES